MALHDDDDDVQLVERAPPANPTAERFEDDDVRLPLPVSPTVRAMAAPRIRDQEREAAKRLMAHRMENQQVPPVAQRFDPSNPSTTVMVLVGRNVTVTWDLVAFLEAPSRRYLFQHGTSDRPLTPRQVCSLTDAYDSCPGWMRPLEHMYVFDGMRPRRQSGNRGYWGWTPMSTIYSRLPRRAAQAPDQAQAEADRAPAGEAEADRAGPSVDRAGPSVDREAPSVDRRAAEGAPCIVCMTDDGDAADWSIVEPCKTRVHKACLRNMVRDKLEKSLLPTCYCNRHSVVDNVDHEIQRTEVLRELFTPAEWETWRSLRSRRAAPGDNTRACPRCKTAVIPKQGCRIFVCGNIACPSPAYGYCVVCLGAIEDHTSHTCTPPEEAAAFLKRMRDRGIMPCPGCRNAAEKMSQDQCNHMTCVCGVRYCAACGHQFPVNARGAANYTHDCPSRNMYRLDRNAIGDAYNKRMRQ